MQMYCFTDRLYNLWIFSLIVILCIKRRVLALTMTQGFFLKNNNKKQQPPLQLATK